MSGTKRSNTRGNYFSLNNGRTSAAVANENPNYFRQNVHNGSEGLMAPLFPPLPVEWRRNRYDVSLESEFCLPAMQFQVICRRGELTSPGGSGCDRCSCSGVMWTTDYWYCEHEGGVNRWRGLDTPAPLNIQKVIRPSRIGMRRSGSSMAGKAVVL